MTMNYDDESSSLPHLLYVLFKDSGSDDDEWHEWRYTM